MRHGPARSARRRAMLAATMDLELASRRAELERLGFTILKQDAGSLVARRSKWHWECFLTNLTTVVLVRRVPTVSAADMGADRRWLKGAVSELDPSALPVGFQKGRAFLMVYLVDHPDPTALDEAAKRPAMELATFHLPAVVDPSGSATYYDHTPIFGGIYFPIFRFLLRRICLPHEPPPAREPKSGVGLALSCGCLGFLLLLCLFPLTLGFLDAVGG